jgi:hypothetical protein
MQKNFTWVQNFIPKNRLHTWAQTPGLITFVSEEPTLKSINFLASYVLARMATSWPEPATIMHVWV